MWNLNGHSISFVRTAFLPCRLNSKLVMNISNWEALPIYSANGYSPFFLGCSGQLRNISRRLKDLKLWRISKLSLYYSSFCFVWNVEFVSLLGTYASIHVVLEVIVQHSNLITKLIEFRNDQIVSKHFYNERQIQLNYRLELIKGKSDAL